jgi:hypothetical protein
MDIRIFDWDSASRIDSRLSDKFLEALSPEYANLRWSSVDRAANVNCDMWYCYLFKTVPLEYFCCHSITEDGAAPRVLDKFLGIQNLDIEAMKANYLVWLAQQ